MQDKKTLEVRHLGMIEYNVAEELQKHIQSQRIEEVLPDTLLLLEHPNVITLGKRGDMADILAESQILKDKGVQVVVTDRGGQNTIHAPGQLVGYVLAHLYREQRALRKFVHDLEQSLIDMLKSFGIDAFHHTEHVGVWTSQGKIGAIGISVNRGVTRHGFALNVSTDLDIFNLIIPCGIKGGQVTSMEQVLGREIDIKDVGERFTEIFSKQRMYDSITHL